MTTRVNCSIVSLLVPMLEFGYAAVFLTILSDVVTMTTRVNCSSVYSVLAVVTQWLSKLSEATAEPKDREGFILAPVKLTCTPTHTQYRLLLLWDLY